MTIHAVRYDHDIRTPSGTRTETGSFIKPGASPEAIAPLIEAHMAFIRKSLPTARVREVVSCE